MGWFDRFRRGSHSARGRAPQTPPEQEPAPQTPPAGPQPDERFAAVVREIADKAVQYAAEIGVDLDYSEPSIDRLESQVMEYYSNALREAQADTKAYGNWAITFGPYLGETLLRNHPHTGFHWAQDENGWPSLRKFDGSRNVIYPSTKVYKRLVNGADSGDSVAGFYQVSVAIMQGKIGAGNNAKSGDQ